MKPQIDNLAYSSFALWLDNRILTKGEAYSNVGSQFYPISPNFRHNGVNYYTYSLPYTQLVADNSISGANVVTGVYVNNIFVGKNASGLHDINYSKGQVYFSGNVGANVSGNFSIKDFNIEITSKSEEELLFESKFSNKSKTPVIPTGLNDNTIVYPIIFLKAMASDNKPRAFGGMDDTTWKVRGVVISDSEFKLNALESILRDSTRRYVPLLAQSELPFNAYGGLISGTYNYTGMTANKVNEGNALFITECVPNRYLGNLLTPPGVVVGFFDVTLSKFRYPLSE